LRSVVVLAAVFALCADLPAAALAQSTAAKPAKPVPPRPLGPELWRGARIGMPQDDIATLFPKATPSKGEALPSGAKSALILPVDLAGAPASAQFYFTTDGLDTIIIDRPDVAAHKTDDNLAKAHKVIDQLTSEHGAPKSCAERRGVTALTCVWELGQAKILFSYRDIGGATPALSVSYRKLKDIKDWAPGPVKKLKPR